MQKRLRHFCDSTITVTVRLFRYFWSSHHSPQEIPVINPAKGRIHRRSHEEKQWSKSNSWQYAMLWGTIRVCYKLL